MYRNRIVEHLTIDAAELRRNPLNHRRHPDSQRAALRSLLSTVGVVDELLAYRDPEHGLTLVDGEARWSEGGSWPVAVLDLTPDEALTVLAMLDKIGAQAEIDPDALMALLDSLPSDARQAAGAAWSDDELAALIGSALPEPGGGGDAFDPTPEDGPTRAQAGDVWRIGGVHRLLVGDCTIAANVARLMGGERAQTTFTDPPYNVGIDYDNGGDDHLQNYAAFSLAWFRACAADCIVFTPGTVNLALWYSIERPKWLCVWRKTNQASPSGLQGFNTWEPLIVYGKQPKPVGHDSWDIPVTQEMDRAHPEHPVAKTMEAWQTFLEAFTTDGALVYDPFLGSGTTLIAAHRTGRRCYGMEIAPRYADVILRRAEAEGLTVDHATA